MAAQDGEDELLRQVALRNAQSILHARRRAEEEIRQQSEWLRVTLASIGDGVISTDADGRVTFMNQVAEALTGWTQADALGHPLTDVFIIVNEQTRATVENPALRALREGAIVGLANHTVLMAKDGTERPIDDSAAPIRSAEGAVIGSVLIFRDITERHRTELALRRSEEEFRDFFDNANVGLHWSDPDGIVLRVNQAELDLLGYTREEYVGRRVTDFHADTAAAEDILRRLGNGEALHNYPARLRCKDGSVRHVLINSTVRWEQGRFIHTRCFTRDITDRALAEQAVRESEQRFRLMADAVPVLIWVSGIDNRRTWFNQTWLDFTGRPVEKELGDGWARSVHPEDLDRCLRTYAAAFDARRHFQMEYRLRRHDGEHRWMLEKGVPRHEATGSYAGHIGSCVDITDRRQAETAIGRLAAIVESSVDAIISKDLDGVISSWNPSAEKMFGYTAAEAVGRHISLIIPPERRSEEDAVLSRIRRGEKVDHFETVRRAKDGRLLNISLTISPVRDATGRIIGAAKVARNVTERKLAEQEREALLASERSARAEAEQSGRLKEEFIATLSHELRNPLAPIRNAIQILRQAEGNPEVLRSSTDLMDRQVTQMVRLVDDLLDVSRITQGKVRLQRERFELASVIAHAVETTRPAMEAAGHRLTVSLPAEPIHMNADPVRLAQIFGNLLHNACKYTDPGGTGRIGLEARRWEDGVSIAVTDNGVGIPPEMLSRIFDRFAQVDRSLDRSRGGLGIGLSLVKTLVELHGGVVSAASKGLGQGSTFVVRLPPALGPPPLDDRPEPSGSAAAPPTDSAAPFAKRRLLVVDDNRDAARTLAKILDMAGHEILIAHDGVEAVDSAGVFRPDIVLLDIGLPKLNGYEAARQIRGRDWGRGMMLIALTGWGQEADRQRSREAGFDVHLVKPVDPETVLKVIAGSSGSARQVPTATSFPPAVMTPIASPTGKLLHDMRNSLAVMQLTLGAMPRMGHDEAQHAEARQTLAHEVASIRTLVAQMEAAFRAGDGRP